MFEWGCLLIDIFLQGVDPQSPLCQSAALLAASKQMKIKLDRRKLNDASGAQKKVFDTLVEKLITIADSIQLVLI